MQLFFIACGRLSLVALHIIWGILQSLLLRSQLGEHWHQHARGKITICGWLQRLARILGLHIHLSADSDTQYPAANIQSFHHDLGAEMNPALLVANHISWLETIAIGSIFPTRFLAKNELRRWPLIGSLTALSGTLFIHRGSRRALQRSQTTISQALSEGQRVMVFPEGTTTDGSSVGRFRPALFETARSAGCPIQPIAISYRSAQRSDPIAPYIDDDKFVPHLWRVLKRGNTHVHLHFCQPLHSRETRQTLADICQARISLAVSNFPQTMRVATPSTTQIDPSQESSTPPWPHLSKTAGRHD